MLIQPEIYADGLHRICTTLCIGLSALWLGAGCSDKDDSAAPDPLCEGDTALTYDTFGEGFFTQYCQGCHASTTAERYGAPADVTFDTAQDIARHRAAIRRTVLGASADMPPGGGVSELDLEKLAIWLDCLDADLWP